MSTLENLNAIEVDDLSSIDINLINNYSPKKAIIDKLTTDYWIKIIRESKLASSEFIDIKLTNNDLSIFKKNYFDKLKKESNFKKIKTFQRKVYKKFGF